MHRFARSDRYGHSVGKPHFYWVSEGLLQSSHGRRFRACGTISGNHAGESRVSSSAVNSRRIQNGVHNSGDNDVNFAASFKTNVGEEEQPSFADVFRGCGNTV